MTGLEGNELVTVAHDAKTGERRWRASVPRKRVDDLAPETGPAVATPASSDDRVFAFFPEFGLVSYDLSGKERWRLELEPFFSYYGLGSSPILESGVLVLVCDASRSPYILGVDAATGKELWRQDRATTAESWTTPVLYRGAEGRALAVVFGSYSVTAYDVLSGKQAWSLPGVGFTPVASPVLFGHMLYAVAPDQSEGGDLPSVATTMALDENGDGRLTESEMATSSVVTYFKWLDMNSDGLLSRSEYTTQLAGLQSPDHGLVAIDLAAPGGPAIAWRQTRTLPYISTPIVYQGVLYLVKDGGILTSYDPSTGAVLQRGRLEGATEPFSPSPVAGGGNLYLASSTGSLAVVKAHAEWQLKALTDFDEGIFATPALAKGRIFVRTRSRLYAFGLEQ